MDWTQEQYDRIAHLLPKQRGNVEVENITFLRALQYIAENGCKWRALPEHFGNRVERNFRLIKEFRRVHTRYDKLDETYNAFIAIANSVIYMRN